MLTFALWLGCMNQEHTFLISFSYPSRDFLPINCILQKYILLCNRLKRKPIIWIKAEIVFHGHVLNSCYQGFYFKSIIYVSVVDVSLRHNTQETITFAGLQVDFLGVFFLKYIFYLIRFLRFQAVFSFIDESVGFEWDLAREIAAFNQWSYWFYDDTWLELVRIVLMSYKQLRMSIYENWT